MTTTGLKVFDDTIHTTNGWLHELNSRMGWDDRQAAWRLLRVGLHAIRDRLPVNAAAHFSAQLPMLVRGMFYEGWQPAKVPHKIETPYAFLAPLREAFSHDFNFDAEAAFRELLDVLRMHVSAEELDNIKAVMPAELKPLWEKAPIGP